jgi:oligopeptide transport system ATP-binding protein
MKKLLEVKNLKVDFRLRNQILQAVRGIDFTLFQGETLGLVGESGCGKSASAKALVKLLPEHTCQISGEIWYDEQEIATYSEKQMQRMRGKEIGMIFQDPMTSLNPTSKIGHQIIEGYLRHHPHISHKAAWDLAIDMLHLVGVPDPEERVKEYPHTLSGGMRQRVMIALALASKPKLLIADEPTTALDVTIQAQILHLLKEIQQKLQMSILLITHDLSIVAGICDRVLVMYAGKIVESATVTQLFSSPQHPYTKRLIQSLPRLDGDPTKPLLPIDGTPPNLASPITGCSFCQRCSDAMQICLQKEPPFASAAPQHYSACWRHAMETP